MNPPNEVNQLALQYEKDNRYYHDSDGVDVIEVFKAGYKQGEKAGFDKAVEMLIKKQRHTEGATIVNRPYEFCADWLEEQWGKK